MPLDLAALLVEARAVPAEAMERALARTREAGGALDTALLELGVLGEPELVRFLSRASGLPAALVAAPDCDPRAARVFPAGIARRHALAPFRLEGRELSLAAVHPVDLEVLADLGALLSMHLVPHVAPEWRVWALLGAIYGLPVPPRLAALAAGPEPARQDVARGHEEEVRHPPARWRLGRADPDQPLARAVARAAEAIDATELLREVIDPEPIPAEPPGWSLAEASAALGAARDRDDVLRVTLRHARDFVEAAAVFAVGPGTIVGVDAVGWPRARARCRAVRLDRDEAGLFGAVIASRGPHLGPMAAQPGNERMLAALGRGWPDTALACPILVRDRVVCLLYADNGDAPVSPRRIGDLLLFAGTVGPALERALRTTRRARPGASPEPGRDGGGWQVHEPARPAPPAAGTAAGAASEEAP